MNECSPLPKDSVSREQLPMRDTMVFKSATRVPRVLHPTPHAPHLWVMIMLSVTFSCMLVQFEIKMTLVISIWIILSSIINLWYDAVWQCIREYSVRTWTCAAGSYMVHQSRVHLVLGTVIFGMANDGIFCFHFTILYDLITFLRACVVVFWHFVFYLSVFYLYHILSVWFQGQ